LPQHVTQLLRLRAAHGRPRAAPVAARVAACLAATANVVDVVVAWRGLVGRSRERCPVAQALLFEGSLQEAVGAEGFGCVQLKARAHQELL
jgi:hypothetical protein